jgi:alpha-L-rhamnosidase
MQSVVTQLHQSVARACGLVLLILSSDMPQFLVASEAGSPGGPSTRLTATECGAIGDGVVLNTTSIQSAIDRLASCGGGTLVVPPGVFVSGALFLKPRVNLLLEKDAVLRASTDVAADFPPRRTRIEGHFEELFTPALINADGCDGLRITGEGTLDGAGRPLWDLFWKLRRASPDPKAFRNLGIPRARLALIENSRDVVIEGVSFKDSQFWNLHLYRCRDVLVKNARFSVPDDYKQAPSTDGIDVDSCRDVTIEGCWFSVTDDAIALKGTKGPFALEDRESPPVEHVRVVDCIFQRAHAAVTLGSEATRVRDVLVEHCRVLGAMIFANFKLRPDTPQRYENIRYQDITLESSGGALVAMQPWKQYLELQGLTPPGSVVRDVSFSRIRGRFGSFGGIAGNPGQTEITSVRFEHVDVIFKRPKLSVWDGCEIQLENVKVNGAPYLP